MFAASAVLVCVMLPSSGQPFKITTVSFVVSATPPAPSALVVYPSSVLALVMWKLNGTGGYPIRSIAVIYQPVTSDLDNPSWHRTFPEEVTPGLVRNQFRYLVIGLHLRIYRVFALQTQLEIYKLEPNTTYRFRVWATNKLGPGDYAEALATTSPLSRGGGNVSLFTYTAIDTSILHLIYLR